MPWGVAAASVAGALINSNASNRASRQQADAANNAASMQQQSTDRAMNMQQAQYDQARADNQVYRTGGANAFNSLQALSQYGPVDTATRVNSVQQAPDSQTLMSQDPGVQYRMQQAQQALTQRANASGNLYGGGYLGDLNALTQNLASQEYGNAYNRWMQDDNRQYNQGIQLDQRDWDRSQTNQNTQWNRLQTLANMGLGATNATTQAGQSFANNSGQLLNNNASAVGNYTTQAANAGAANTVNNANNWTNALNTGAGVYAYQNQQPRVNVTSGTSNPAPQSLNTWGTTGSTSWY